jgi:hypothetical protein
MVAICERIPQSLQFKSQTEKREQRPTEQQPPPCHQKGIGIIIERREMPEENHRE